MLAPCMSNHLGARMSTKTVHCQAFCSGLAVETVIFAVLPEFTGLNAEIAQTLYPFQLY
jgi:hypothetical protein